ncbi:MAG: hypothetical protein H6721_04930 [Sandaracinus sp.]|nr:hypothetical protein [Sandaracinus sp.]MCB9631472.1 hypothetical protein [Sandaracinus sp.]
MSEHARFWSWFVAALPTLEAAYREDDVAALAREVEAGLRSSGVGGRWEIGPLDEATCFFAFGAPDGERLARNRALVAGAPEVPGWVFLAAKPPRRWQRRTLEVRSSVGLREVDFDPWRFSASRTNRGWVVRVLPVGAEGWSFHELDGLAWTLLDAELGEERVIETVSDVVVVDSLDDGRSVARMKQRLV